MKRFHDAVVWITGGGTGIGRALALAFAREGARVVVSGRRPEPLDEVVAEVTSLGREGLAAVCDVTDESQIDDTLAQLLARFGRLDVVVANAGFCVNGRVERLSAADWRRQLDTNVVGAAVTASKCLPALRHTRGRVVFVASVAGNVTYPGGAAYAASKFALRAIGLTLGMELHGSGVTCTTIHPGLVESDIGKTDNLAVFKPEREDPRPTTFMWPAERAARVMLGAIYRRQREVVVTGHGKLGAFLGRHLPGVTCFFMERAGVEKMAHFADQLGDRR
ncbi:MAG: SDR family NAD(P)-dependent oxidoreductase [Myxococcota bacterium]